MFRNGTLQGTGNATLSLAPFDLFIQFSKVNATASVSNRSAAPNVTHDWDVAR